MSVWGYRWLNSVVEDTRILPSTSNWKTVAADLTEAVGGGLGLVRGCSANHKDDDDGLGKVYKEFPTIQNSQLTPDFSGIPDW